MDGFGGKENLLQVQIAVRAPKVFHFKALHLDFLDQPLIKGVQSV